MSSRIPSKIRIFLGFVKKKEAQALEFKFCNFEHQPLKLKFPSVIYFLRWFGSSKGSFVSRSLCKCRNNTCWALSHYEHREVNFYPNARLNTKVVRNQTNLKEFSRCAKSFLHLAFKENWKNANVQVVLQSNATLQFRSILYLEFSFFTSPILEYSHWLGISQNSKHGND